MLAVKENTERRQAALIPSSMMVPARKREAGVSRRNLGTIREIGNDLQEGQPSLNNTSHREHMRLWSCNIIIESFPMDQYQGDKSAIEQQLPLFLPIRGDDSCIMALKLDRQVRP